MLETITAPKIFLCIFLALIVFAITGLIIGPERKAKWFQKRKTYSFLNRRGIISEVVHFGYPCTIEGGIITTCMLGIIAIFIYLVLIW